MLRLWDLFAVKLAVGPSTIATGAQQADLVPIATALVLLTASACLAIFFRRVFQQLPSLAPLASANLAFSFAYNHQTTQAVDAIVLPDDWPAPNSHSLSRSSPRRIRSTSNRARGDSRQLPRSASSAASRCCSSVGTSTVMK